MTYTVKLDFWMDENEVRSDDEIQCILKEVFGHCNFVAENIEVLEVND